MPRTYSLYFAPIAALSLALAGSAQAQSMKITSASGLSAGDATLSFVVVPGTIVPSYTGSAGNNTLNFTDAGNAFVEQTVGVSIVNSGFANGTNLLETEDNILGSPTAPMTISFSSPVSEFGLSAENDYYGTDTFSFTVFSGTKSLGAYAVTTNNNATSGTGTASFLGAKATGTALITRVVISSASTSDGHSNLFAFGPVTFSPTAAPEPSQFAAFAVGLLGMGALTLKAKKRTA